MGILTVGFIQLFHFTLFYFARKSPTLVLKDEAIRLSKLEHVTWSLKDNSKRGQLKIRDQCKRGAWDKI